MSDISIISAVWLLSLPSCWSWRYPLTNSNSINHCCLYLIGLATGNLDCRCHAAVPSKCLPWVGQISELRLHLMRLLLRLQWRNYLDQRWNFTSEGIKLQHCCNSTCSCGSLLDHDCSYISVGLVHTEQIMQLKTANCRCWTRSLIRPCSSRFAYRNPSCPLACYPSWGCSRRTEQCQNGCQRRYGCRRWYGRSRRLCHGYQHDGNSWSLAILRLGFVFAAVSNWP